MEANFLGHLHVLNQSFSRVSTESSRVALELEAESINHFNLSGRQRVHLSHALDLLELHVVSILELVPLILVDGDYAWVSLLDINHDEGFSIFSVSVCNCKFISVV